jgi:hypothetical protein
VQNCASFDKVVSLCDAKPLRADELSIPFYQGAVDCRAFVPFLKPKMGKFETAGHRIRLTRVNFDGNRGPIFLSERITFGLRFAVLIAIPVVVGWLWAGLNQSFLSASPRGMGGALFRLNYEPYAFNS